MHKLLVIFVCMALIMIAAISAVMYIENRRTILNQYSDLALSYAKAGAEYIDGDRVSGYLSTGETDSYYEDVKHFFNLELENSELTYYYVIVPLEEEYIYVWDANNSEEVAELGTHETYEEYEEATMKAAFSREPEIRVTSGSTEQFGRLVSLYYPVYDSEGEPVALVGVDLSMPGLTRNIYRTLLALILCMIPVILIVTAMVFWYLRKRLIHPILLMNTAAGEMAENIDQKNEISIPVSTGDEIEDLARTMEKMYQELREYIDELYVVTADRERVETELSIAARIQSDLLPSTFPAFPDRKEFDLSAAMIPAKEVGGDFYDFFLVDDDHLALLIADVSGKGVPAAMFMVIARTLIKNAVQSGISPKEAFWKVNNQLCESNETGMFVTMWLGILTISDGTLTCSNAGHEYPVIGRKGGDYALLHDRHGLMLAGMENTKYREYEISLSVGDTLFVYTDGATEAMNAENEEFGTGRILASLNAAGSSSCRELITQVCREIEKFEDGTPQYDDITMLCLKFKRKEKSRTETKITLDRQPVLTEFIENTFAEWQVPMKNIISMNIALDEIYSNIVYYSGADSVKITCGLEENEITLTFEDNGSPFDPTEKEDADTSQSAEEREIGGLGIFLVKKSMDRMEYRYFEGKNILTLRIRL